MRAIHITLVCCFFTLGAVAQPDAEREKLIKQADELFDSESYVQALPLYSQLVSLEPRNADYNMRFGVCALFGGEAKTTAIKHLNFAANKGDGADAWYYLGIAHHRNYSFDEAIAAYRKFLEQSDPKKRPSYPVARQIEMAKNGQGLLSALTDVVVIDKKQAPESEFFRYYNLENIGGKILTTPEELLTKADRKAGHRGVIHFPKGANVVYYSSYGANTSTGLDIYQATRVAGEFTDIRKVDGPINTAMDEEFPFLHPDGNTLYFASKGHNSMGGYDIFVSRREPTSGQWSDPVNLDFAINTPDDDLFYVADSLNQRAFFASGRSSAAGDLHVYEVLVSRMPVNLIFIQGNFISEVQPGENGARIEVVDELTGRPVAETQTDPVSGAFLLTVPKSGLYTFRVEAKHSLYRHEGPVEVPIVDASVAFRQELSLIEESGQEKLIISNYFESPLDVDLMAMSQEYLRQQSGLEVNATDERIAAAQRANPTGARLDDGAAPHLTAGFSGDETPESIRNKAFQDADNFEKRAALSEGYEAVARQQAGFHQQEAIAATRAAERIWMNADPSNETQYLEEMSAYAAAYQKAKESALNARAALNAAASFKGYALEDRERATEIRTQIQTAEHATETGDDIAAAAAYRWEKDRINDAANAPQLPSDEARQRATMLQGKQSGLLDEIGGMNAEIDAATRTIARLEKSIASSSRAKEKAAFEAELAATQAERTSLQAQVDRAKANLEELSVDEVTSLRGALLFEALINEDSTDPEGFDSAEPYAPADLASLRSMDEEFAALEPADDERVGTAGEEMRVTRNDIVTAPTVQAQAKAMDVELVDAATLQSEWESIQQSIQEPNARSDENVARLEEQVQRQLGVYERAEEEAVSDTERAAIERERTALTTLAASLKSAPRAEGQKQGTTQELEQTTDAVIARVNPNYAAALEELKQSDISDLERSVRTQTLMHQTLVALESELNEAQAALASPTEETDSTAVEQRISVARAAIEAFSSRTDDYTDIQVAYESEAAAIVASEEVFREKLTEQIQLTEQYRLALTELESRQRADLERTTDPVRRNRLEENLSKLAVQIAAADDKLETYQGDLALALATDEGPATSDVSVVPEGDAVMPFNVTEAKTALAETYPAFEADWGRAQQAASRADADLALDELDGRIERQIAEQEGLLQVLQDARLQQEVQGELLELRRLKDWSTAQRNVLENEGLAATAVLEPRSATFAENPAEGAEGNPSIAGEGLSSSAGSIQDAASEATSRPETSRPGTNDSNRVIQQVNQAVESRERIAAPEYENYAQVEGLRADLGGLEMALKAETRNGKRKKLEKDIQRKRRELAKEELTYQDQLATESQLILNGNDALLDEFMETYSEDLSFDPMRQRNIASKRSEARRLTKEAEVVREQAASTKGDFDRNEYYKAAVALEVQAMEIQEQAIHQFQSYEQARQDAIALAEPAEGEMIQPESAPETEAASFARIEETPFSPVSVPEDMTAWLDGAEGTFTLNDADGASASASLENARIAADQVNALAAERATLQATINNYQQTWSSLDPGAAPDDSTAAAWREERARLVQQAEVSYAALQAVNRDLESATVRMNRYLGEAEQVVETAREDAEAEAARDAAIAADESEAPIAEREAIETAGGTAGIEPGANAVEVPSESLDATAESVEPAETSESIRDTPEAIEAVETDEASTETELEERSPSSGSSPETLGTVSPAPIAFPALSGPSITAEVAEFFEVPTVLTDERFTLTATSIYTSERRIPIDAKMPEGVIYKIQVGAYRNAIPQDLFAEFAPVHGESLDNGITRYSAGLFLAYNRADAAKEAIRDMGYSDAFVVAFRNGVRINVSEARESQTTDAVAATEEPVEPNPRTAIAQPAVEATAQPPVREAPLEAYAANPNYNAAENAAAAVPVETLEGTFFTVQVGVYSKPVGAAVLFNIEPLNTELLENGNIRYTSGQFAGLEAANAYRDQVRGSGVTDAFVTAYSNGRRIAVGKALEGGVVAETSAAGFEVVIGAFAEDIPAEVAQAMLLFEAEFGILQREVNERFEYYTRPVSSREEAESIRAAFRDKGVSGLIIRPLR